MKFIRTIAALLIMVMATTPAMAAACAIQCADMSADMSADRAAAKVMVNKVMMEMPDCHEQPSVPDTDQTSHNHNSCDMAGCHIVQMAPLLDLDKPVFSVVADTAFPRADSQVISADLSPPIKPPA